MSKLPKEQLYFLIAHSGAIVLAGLGVAYAFDAPDFAKGFLIGVLLVLIVMLFRRKMRDEYIERLWNAGTATAFISMICLTLSGDFLRGVYDGFMHVQGHSPDIPSSLIGMLALAAFYIGFHIEMIKERV